MHQAHGDPLSQRNAVAAEVDLEGVGVDLVGGHESIDPDLLLVESDAVGVSLVDDKEVLPLVRRPATSMACWAQRAGVADNAVAAAVQSTAGRRDRAGRV